MTAREGEAAQPVRVLVVDDQELIREGIASLLAIQEGIEVVGTACDGHDAIGKAVELAPDVVLMDVRMPVMDGVQAVAELSRCLPACRVVMLTTFDDEEYVVSALRAGAAGYLLKDLPSRDLAAAVRLTHAGVTPLGPTAAARLAAAIPQGPWAGQADFATATEQTLRSPQASRDDAAKTDSQRSRADGDDSVGAATAQRARPGREGEATMAMPATAMPAAARSGDGGAGGGAQGDPARVGLGPGARPIGRRARQDPWSFVDGPEAVLTAREIEVVRLVAEGMTNREIAQRLYLSEGTVKNHLSRILERLGLRDRTQAALYARDHGLLGPPTSG